MKLGASSDRLRRFGAGRRPDSKATELYLEKLRETVPLLKALLFTGSRLGEIVELRWQDVDLKRGTITIVQEKTGRQKTLPMSEKLREVMVARPRGIGDAHVFTRADGRPFKKYEVQRAFAVAKMIAGVRRELTPHSLRHTFASWLVIEGTPLRTVQELLGHSDIRMTLRYAHLSPAHLKSAVEVVGLYAEKSFKDWKTQSVATLSPLSNQDVS